MHAVASKSAQLQEVSAPAMHGRPGYVTVQKTIYIITEYSIKFNIIIKNNIVFYRNISYCRRNPTTRTTVLSIARNS